MVGIELDELTLGRLDANTLECAVRGEQGVCDRFEIADAVARGQVLHLRDRGRRGTKLRAPMHEREASGFARKLECPIERRIAAAEDDEPLTREVSGALYLIVNVATLERIDPFASELARLEGTETARNDDRLRVKARI